VGVFELPLVLDGVLAEKEAMQEHCPLLAQWWGSGEGGIGENGGACAGFERKHSSSEDDDGDDDDGDDDEAAVVVAAGQDRAKVVVASGSGDSGSGCAVDSGGSEGVSGDSGGCGAMLAALNDAAPWLKLTHLDTLKVIVRMRLMRLLMIRMIRID
jgi:hypothetical protein